MRTHREEFIAATSDDHIFVTDLSLGHRPIRNLSDRNSVAEILFCPAIHIRDLSSRRLYLDHTSSSKIEIWNRPHGVVTLKVKGVFDDSILNRIIGGDTAPFPRRVAQDECLLARCELSLGRTDLPLRQSVAA